MSKKDIIARKNEELLSTSEQLKGVLTELNQLYEKSVRSIEGITGFNMNCMRPLGANHLLQKPSCMFIGPYSSGKSTALSYLLQTNDPAIRTGPEPTTDTFHFLLWGPKTASGECAYLMNDPSFGLDNFFEDDGSAQHARWTTMPNNVLSSILIVDSPGFLSGENMTQRRGFDISALVAKFAKKVTRIFVMIDVTKVDISSEFKSTMRMLRPFLGKVRLILNKSDSVTPVQLLRLYAAFMFALGQIVESPEVPRVYVCSLWDQPYVNGDHRHLFDAEKLELLNDLQKLPACHYPNVVGNMMERMNCFLRYLVVVREFRKTMPFFKKEAKKTEILNGFKDFYLSALRTEGIMAGDVAIIDVVKQAVSQIDVHNIPDGCTKKNIDQLKLMISDRLPSLLTKLNQVLNQQDDSRIEGGVFSILETSNKLIEAEEAQRFNLSDEDIRRADDIFSTFVTHNGRADAAQLKPAMLESKLPYESLAKIWELASDSSGGTMDMYEWRIAHFLLSFFRDGRPIPSTLPPHLQPSKMRRSKNESQDF